jgi:hypothetical protein
MGTLPIPVDMFFSDFAFDLTEYSVRRDGSIMATYKGLTNSDESGQYIAFKMDCDIEFGDILIRGTRCFVVKMIDHDNYDGEPAMLKAYY